MKTNKLIYSLWLMLAAALTLGVMSSCSDEGDILDDESDSLPYLFRPGVFKAEVVNNTTTVNLSWAAVSGALSYSIEIYEGELDFSSDKFVTSDIVEGIVYTVELAGDTRYSARVKANPNNPDRDSYWNGTVTFKTPAENLFYGYSAYMGGQGIATVNWAPGKTVTKLVFTMGVTTREFPISSAEAVAGKKDCSGLANGQYTINIYNDEIDRGQTTVLIEGDVFLAAGDDFETVFASAADGAVLVLAEGATYAINTKSANAVESPAVTEGFLINKNITIRGLSETSRSVLYGSSNLTAAVGDGGAGATALLDLGATLTSVTFKNLDISGIKDNVGTTKMTYLVNQKNAAVIANLTFANCEIHDFNGGMRFQSGGTHDITNFTIDQCIIHDMGAGYGIINFTVGKADNIKVTNTTTYKTGHSLILHTSANSVSVAVENCTFDDMNQATTRYILDYNGRDVTGGISFRNCIVGKGVNSGGIRTTASNVTASGSYYTNDYVTAGTGAYSITNWAAGYTGASTDMFTDPANGDFTIKDTSFPGRLTAGDPRWR